MADYILGRTQERNDIRYSKLKQILLDKIFIFFWGNTLTARKIAEAREKATLKLEELQQRQLRNETAASKEAIRNQAIP